MANKTKKNPKVLQEIYEELATGASIRSCLSPRNKKEDRPCWQSFRTWMAKDPEIRKNYEQAKTDGIEYLMLSLSSPIPILLSITLNIVGNVLAFTFGILLSQNDEICKNLSNSSIVRLVVIIFI